eukprot:COSAG02_NODE_307_length_25111_cov_5.306693_3_plen_467_part_00
MAVKLLLLHQLASLYGLAAATAATAAVAATRSSTGSETAVASATTPLVASGWTHSWDSPASAWLGYGAFGEWVSSDAEIAFIAKTYKIVVLSLNNADITMNMSVAEATMNVSARLKAVNPALKVLQYFNMEMFAGYSNADPEYATFLEHPEWWLRDDYGNPVMSQFGPGYDFSNQAAVDHWLSMPLGPESRIVDGFLLDGAAGYSQPANISATRAEVLKLAKWKAVGRMQQRLTAANDGLVLANGMIGGVIDPHVEDPYNLGALNYAQGIENERGTPAFELVDRVTGAFELDAVAANLAAIEQASQLANGTKLVSVNYWAGPIIGFSQAQDNTRGFPLYAPEDPDNRVPNGTRAEVFAGWQRQLTKWLPFNLAMFLSVAGPRTYFTQMVWYASFQGFVPCPDAPSTCCAPTPFYPDMHRSLGAPKAPRRQVAKYKWVRDFENAAVTLDLEDPLGPGTSIVWERSLE